VRDLFGAAWPLFQVSLPTCLPLAVIAVVAGASPVAQALPMSRQWWGVVAVRAAMVLICYGAMLRQQLQFAAGERPRLLQSLRDALRDAPSALAVVGACLLPFLPAVASTAMRGFDAVALLLTVAASALLVFLLPAWPSMIAGRTLPWVAMADSIRLVRGRWLQFAGLVLVLLVGVLVCLLLGGILIGAVMNLAGQGVNPTPNALAASVWLTDILLAVVVVHAGAVAVVTWRVTAGADPSAASRAP
jgi:hypothetical protein